MVRVLFVVTLLSGTAAAEQLKSPHGELVDVDDAYLQSALEQGYKRVSAQEASDLATKPADQPSSFDWRLVGLGAVAAAIGAGGWYVIRAKK
jgi:hypothetical protein